MQTNINSKLSGQKYTTENSLQQEIRIFVLPPQQQSRQDHSFYVVYYIALCGQFLLEQDSYLLATFA